MSSVMGMPLFVGFATAIAHPANRGQFQVTGGQALSLQSLPDDPTGVATLSFSGLQPGSDIVVLVAGTSIELLNVDANPGTAYDWVSARFAAPTLVDIGIFKVGFVPYTLVRGFSLPYTDAILPISQIIDRNYRNP